MRIFFRVLFGVSVLYSCTQKMEEAQDSQKERLSSTALDSIQPTVIRYDSIIDLGEVKNIAEGEFIIVNEGPNPLHVAAISPSCGCTTATKAPKKPIAIGDSLKIDIKVDVDRVEEGEFEKTVTVLSNSQERVLFLRIIGKKV